MSGRHDESIVMKDIVIAAKRLIELGESAHWSPDPDRDTGEMILWNLTVLGEAAKRVSPVGRERFADVDWSAMARTRDVIVHHYEGVDWEVVARIISDDLPALLPRLTTIRDAFRAEADLSP
ncbi:MAG: DUF86 domain-containing protein [Actinomycetota bacterium]|nr:DUF86 domain-containing protein [Actinomycetota bacterium]